MLVRIVKLTFQEDKLDEFLVFFDRIKQEVNNFPGCLGMKLIQGIDNSCIIMTYSHWESEVSLENYRKSETFTQIWQKIKPWFSAKPEAWSMTSYFDGFTS